MCQTLRNQNTNEENTTGIYTFITTLDLRHIVADHINTDRLGIYVSAQTVCLQTLTLGPIPKVGLNCLALLVCFTEITKYGRYEF